MEGEGCDHGKNREASSFGGDTELGGDESESSGEGVEMVTSEADDTEIESTRLFRVGLYQLLRAPEAAYTVGFVLTRRAEGLLARVFLILRLPLTVFCMVAISRLHCVPGKQRDLLSISPDRYARLFSKDVRELKRDFRKNCPNKPDSEENELEIALHVEEENTLEQALQVGIEASVEMSTGKMQDPSPPPTTQEEVRRPPFRKVFKHSQKVELNGLLAVGCFKVVDENNVPKGRKVVGSRWVHMYKGDGHENCLKTKSRVVAKGFTQVQVVDYHKTTSPTSASAPVKMIAAIANEKGLPVFRLDVSQAFVQAPLEGEIYMRLPPG